MRRAAQQAARDLPLLPTTTIGSFPQTAEIRRARAAHVRGDLTAGEWSRVLATNLGQVLFVAEADRTAQSTISEALSTIESCPVVMTVLNKARRTADAPYGYRH